MGGDMDEVCDALMRDLDGKDRAREDLIRTCRVIRRSAGRAISAIVRGEQASPHLDAALSEWSALQERLGTHPEILYSGTSSSALEELAEASVLNALVSDGGIPDHTDLSVPPQVYICGFADCIGELRRLSLRAIDEGDADLASRYLELMMEMHDRLMRFDVPSALAQVRRKQDVSRSLVERTQGEVIMGKLMMRSVSPTE